MHSVLKGWHVRWRADICDFRHLLAEDRRNPISYYTIVSLFSLSRMVLASKIVRINDIRDVVRHLAVGCASKGAQRCECQHIASEGRELLSAVQAKCVTGRRL